MIDWDISHGVKLFCFSFNINIVIIQIQRRKNMEQLPISQQHQSAIALQDQFKKHSSIYIDDAVSNGIFRREGIESGYVFNIGYDQLTLTLEQNNDDSAASQIQHLDDYDRSVYDAVCTLYNKLTIELKQKRILKRKQLEESGASSELIDEIFNDPVFKFPMFNTKMVYRIIIGDENPDIHPSEDSLKRIEASLDVLCSMRVDISLFKQQGNQKTKDSSHTNNLLYLGKHKKKSRIPDGKTGQMIEVLNPYYIIYEIPVLYDYASNNSMLSALPTEKVKTASINMTNFNIILVSKIRNKVLNGSTSVIIHYQELYQVIEEDGVSIDTINKRKQRLRQTVQKILNDWKSTNFIDDWNVIEYGARKVPLSLIIYNNNNYKYDNMISQYQKYELHD